MQLSGIFELRRVTAPFPIQPEGTGQLVFISKREQQRLQFRKVRNVCAEFTAVMMLFAKIDNPAAAEEIVSGQVRAEVVEINNIVRNDALRVELNENEIAHAKVGADNR